MKEFQTEGMVLVVDLDGTLIKSDTLFECFWSAIGQNPFIPFQCVRKLIQGKTELKKYLSEVSDVDVSLLPYNHEVINYISKWRDQGGRTALVTASDETIALEIAGHLELFDEVYGTKNGQNLKGEDKAAFLNTLYGEKKYIYMGDSSADLNVWPTALRSVSVNASKSVKQKLQEIDESCEHISTGEGYREYFRALRPHQWMKNVLIFVPVLTAHKFDFLTIGHAFMAFFAFSFIASSVYLLNDLIDLKSDRQHPRKCRRPLASGTISIVNGTILLFILLAIGVGISALLSVEFLGAILLYYILTICYSLSLKEKEILDICTLAGLYTLRVIAGGLVVDVNLSVWLLAFSIFFFFSLAAIKRHAELVDMVGRNVLKAKGRGYHVEDLPLVSQVSISSGYVSILILALYLNSPTVVELYSMPEALWGICFVLLYWLTRMMIVSHRGQMNDDPLVYAVKDRVSLVCLLLVGLFLNLGIYL